MAGRRVGDTVGRVMLLKSQETPYWVKGRMWGGTFSVAMSTRRCLLVWEDSNTLEDIVCNYTSCNIYIYLYISLYIKKKSFIPIQCQNSQVMNVMLS